MTHTLTYSQQSEGWPSFYSYYPDRIIGMNNFLYTFKGGDLYRHNVNAKRNTFYEDYWKKVGDSSLAFTPTQIKSVFNDVPLENKLFKTLNLEGDTSWDALMITDLEFTGFIDSDWFEKKEQSWYSFVRNSGTVPASPAQYPLRSLNGIGRSYQVVGGNVVKFSISPLIDIGSVVSVGDYLYFATPPYDSPQLAGEITAIDKNYPQGINQIQIDTSTPGAVPIPIQDAYFLYIKNSVAESHGVLGHYCVFTLTNDETTKVELFAAESEVMKSFP